MEDMNAKPYSGIPLLAAALLVLAALVSGCSTADKEDREIAEKVAQMTREEKVLFVMGTQRLLNNGPEIAPGMIKRPWKNENARQISNYYDPGDATTAYSKKRNGAAGETYAISRLGIPMAYFADGPTGLRLSVTQDNGSKTYSTGFPSACLLGASWDTELMDKVGTAMGNETLEFGMDFLLAPSMNILRNPLCGRNFEYYAEDPLLSGKLAASFVCGFQSQGVGVSVKHFAANNEETMRNGIDAVVSERALREIYFKGFEIVVKESKPWTVMSAYNKLNGVLASENPWLLNDVLRGEWGFDGTVVTDWWSEENGARQVAAGNDLLMPGTQHQEDDIFAALEDGSLDEALLDKACFNILKTLRKTPSFHAYPFSNHPNVEAHESLARSAAAEGMVLLENNGALPLSGSIKRIAALGNAMYYTYVSGSGSGSAGGRHKICLDEGLESAGYVLDEAAAEFYRKYVNENKPRPSWIIPNIPEPSLAPEQIARMARENDAAIYAIGRIAGEGSDREAIEGDYYLSVAEMLNLRLLSEAFHAEGKPLIVILNMGSCVDMMSWKDIPDAILHAWYPGQEAGYAITDVLTGAVNPSGKLPFTIAAKYEDVPSSSDFPLSEGEDRRSIYHEDIFVGYRGFDADGIEPAYPFGYGLSYTSFEYSDLSVKKEGKEYQVTLRVKNTGQREGREVVQIYVAAPKSRLAKPEKELRAFVKTPVIPAGESVMISARFAVKDLSSFDPSQHKWVLDKGDYTLMAASSSRDIRASKIIKIK